MQWSGYLASHIYIQTRFSSGECHVAAALRLKILHSFQQSLIVLLAPHHGGTKEGHKCKDQARPVIRQLLWSLSLCVASRTRLANLSFGHSGKHGKIIAAGVSLFGEVA